MTASVPAMTAVGRLLIALVLATACGGVAAPSASIDWCTQGADVQFFTNEQPPFLNKLVVNHALASLVDGERGMQLTADRFNHRPTSPTCGDY